MYLQTFSTLLLLMILVSVPTLSMTSESVLKAGKGRVRKAKRVAIGQKKEKYGLCGELGDE